LAFAGTPFDCWQGSIKFRFNVVCSEYHRGRLRIVYNPKGNPGGAVPFNQTYSTVIDITESRDFEYEVKWTDVRAWNRLDGIDTVSLSPLHDDSSPIAPVEGEDNGTLSVYVSMSLLHLVLLLLISNFRIGLLVEMTLLFLYLHHVI
jgi:hypothetical protein